MLSVSVRAMERVSEGGICCFTQYGGFLTAKHARLTSGTCIRAIWKGHAKALRMLLIRNPVAVLSLASGRAGTSACPQIPAFNNEVFRLL